MKKISFALIVVVSFFGFAHSVFAGINTSGQCIAGTTNQYGQGTCQVYVNNQPVYTQYCTGNETSGPCDPQRIDPNAASQLAVLAEQNLKKSGYPNSTCSTERVYFPGIDTNTALNYYMNTTCTVNGVSGLMASSLMTPTGLAALPCDLAHAGVSGVSCTGGSSGTSVNSVNLSQTTTPSQNLAGISQQNLAKYLPGGFDPTSGHDQATALQLKTIDYSTNIINKAFKDFQDYMSGKTVGPNALGIIAGLANVTKDTGVTQSGEQSFRYLKIDMTRAGWDAVREIEVYDKNGNKISMTGVKATASCSWCNYGTPPINVDPSEAIDGDVESMWNAGETASGCDWFTPGPNGSTGCPSSTLRSAWIKIDFGKTILASRIRFNSTGNSNENDVLSISNDDSKWNILAKFTSTPSSPFADYQWLEWPTVTNSNPILPPAVSFTVNGSSQTSVHSSGDAALFSWRVENADQVSFSVSGQNKQCIPYGDPDPYKWLSFPYAPDNATGIHGVGNQFDGTYFWQDFFGCEKGNNIVITLKAVQNGGKSATASVTVSVDNINASNPKVDNPNTPGSKWGYGINANYQEFYLTPGKSTTLNSFTGQPVIIQTSVDAGIYLSLGGGGGVTAAYPFPIITAESNNKSIHVTLGNPVNVPISQTDVPEVTTKRTQTYTVSVDSSIAPGTYKIRIYGNRGKADEGFQDVAVFIANSISSTASGLKPAVQLKTAQ